MTIAPATSNLPEPLGPPGPASPSSRIEAMDVLRGLALLGILIMNIPFAALPGEAGWNPSVAGGATGVDWWTWFLATVFVDGKARALFSMLFGAGVVLMAERAGSKEREPSVRVADLHYRRMLWLMAFGLVDAYLLAWPGDIIFIYGLCGLLLFPLRRLAARTLIGAGVAMLVLTVTFELVRGAGDLEEYREVQSIRAAQDGGATLTDEQQATLDDWNDSIAEDQSTPEEIAEEIEDRRRGYIDTVVHTAPIIKGFHSTPIYFETDALAMMLIGMGLLRARVLTGERSRGFYVACAAVCLPLGWTIGALAPYDWSRSGFDLEHFSPWWADWAWTYQAQRLLVAIGYIGVVMLWCRSGALRWIQRAAAAAGRLALTNYLGQSVAYIVLFTGAGFALVGELGRFEITLVAIAVWIVQAIFSVAWSSAFAFGPMEFVWRWLTYGRRPAWRRESR